MEVYSPRKSRPSSFSRNEIRQEHASRNETPAYFYDIKPVKTRRETFTEWLDRRVYVPLREFFEKDVVE